MKLIDTYEREVKNDLESFKSVWRSLGKQQKGDVVEWDKEQYKVEDVRDVPKDIASQAQPGEKLYTICRFESSTGVNLKILCHKITAKPGEWQSK
jgi:hypothetical protein